MIRRNDLDYDKIVLLYTNHKITQKKIAKMVGCSQWKIQEILKDRKIKPEYRRKLRKLTENDINTIIELYEKGVTTSKIANKIGCCGDYIRKILNKNGISTQDLKARCDREDKCSLPLVTINFQMHIPKSQERYLKINALIVVA